MLVYHGTRADTLDEVVQYGAVLCPIDLAVHRHLKLQEKGYFKTVLYKEELEKLFWDDAEEKRRTDSTYNYRKRAHVYVAVDPYLSYQRNTDADVILGFDLPDSMVLDGLLIHRTVPLNFLDRVLYMQRTDLAFVKRILRNYNVPYEFYDHNTGKINSGEESLVCDTNKI